MNIAETLELLRELKKSGATHFKSQDFEVTLGVSPTLGPLNSISPAAGSAQVQQSPPENAEATEKLKELIKTMSMPPEQLVDHIFPNGAGG